MPGYGYVNVHGAAPCPINFPQPAQYFHAASSFCPQWGQKLQRGADVVVMTPAVMDPVLSVMVTG
jgi:hypothetical protein